MAWTIYEVEIVGADILFIQYNQFHIKQYTHQGIRVVVFVTFIYNHMNYWCHTHSHYSWWRHQMETFSALLALYAGNSPVTCEFPSQRPVTRSFDIFFHLCLNKRLSKQSWGWWFETPSNSLCRHCNVMYCKYQMGIPFTHFHLIQFKHCVLAIILRLLTHYSSQAPQVCCKFLKGEFWTQNVRASVAKLFNFFQFWYLDPLYDFCRTISIITSLCVCCENTIDLC